MNAMLDDITPRITATLLQTRWLVRAPVWVYRARLGALFGGRLLMMQHTGRNSRRRRYVVLEVIDHPSPRRWIVVSGFGERAQWLRNVQHDPHVRLFVQSHRPVPAVASRLDPQAAAATLTRYAASHPLAWSRLRPVLERTLGTPIGATGTTLPLVALDLEAESLRDGCRQPSDLKRRLTRIGNRIGVWMYRTLDGRLSSGSKNVHVLMITTPGRRTGIPRSTCVRYLETPSGLVVWGTGSGSRRDPDWFENLRNATTVRVQIRAHEFPVRAHELHGEERETMWRGTILAQAPEVGRYAEKAGRTIPVAVLEPLHIV